MKADSFNPDFNLPIVIAMPAFNESPRITDFLKGLEREMLKAKIDAQYVVVDDSSTDNMFDRLQELKSSGFNITLIRNEVNLGHGPSTLIALKTASKISSQGILIVDGDGHYATDSLRSLITKYLQSNYDVIEGYRIYRIEPIYRRVISSSVKLLVGIKSGRFPRDANSPVRIYRPNVVPHFLESIPQRSLIPNLHISAITRMGNFSYFEFPVVSQVRQSQNDFSRSSPQNGTTWDLKYKFLPNRKLLKFCLKALYEWLKLKFR